MRLSRFTNDSMRGFVELEFESESLELSEVSTVRRACVYERRKDRLSGCGEPLPYEDLLKYLPPLPEYRVDLS